MENQIKNYEAQIANLKNWRNWLYIIIGALIIINIYGGIKNVKPSDGEVLKAAIDVEFEGVDKYIMFYPDQYDKEAIIMLAREDKKVMEQVKRNRKEK